MHFGIVLIKENNYSESQEFYYSLQFLPVPIILKQNKQILNLNPSSPQYKLGSMRKLIEKENLKFNSEDNNEAVIMIKDKGHGTKQDLRELKSDLKSNGFNVKVCDYTE